MTKARLAALVTVTVVMVAAVALNYDGFSVSPERPPEYLQSAVFDKYRSVAIIGESFVRTWLEQRVFFQENNSSSRTKLFETLKKEGPSLLIFLGNLVARGASANEWRKFDELVSHFQQTRIPLLAVSGEREYAGFDSVAGENLVSRFPALQNTRWYMLIYLNMAFVFLNSNYSEMSAGEWSDQLDWYQKTLAEIDAHGQLDGAVVFLHHPPFTNGRESTATKAVERDLFPPFIDAEKTVLMVAGHTGAYEKFYEKDKYVLVSGGGGGPLARLNEGESTHEDHFRGQNPPPFHYLLLQPVQGGITLEVKGFYPDEQNIRQIEKSFIPFR